MWNSNDDNVADNELFLKSVAVCLGALILMFSAFLWLGAATAHTHDGGCGSNEGDYLAGAVTMHLAMKEGRPLRYLLNPGFFMAPLQLILAQPLFALENHGVKVMRHLNLVYLFALLCATCVLAARLFGKPAGVLAALLLISFNATFTVAWFYHQLILTGLFITLTILFLLESNRLRNKGMTLLTGLCMAGALLSHRGSPLLMLAPPVGLYFLISIWEVRSRFVLFGLIALLGVAAIPAYGHLHHYYALKVTFTAEQVDAGLNQNRDLFHFVKTLSELHLTKYLGWCWPMAAAFIAWRGRKDSRLWVLLAAALPPLFWFGFFGTKNADYIYPIIPMIAVMIAGAAWLIPMKAARFIAVGFLAIVSIIMGLFMPNVFSHPGKYSDSSFLYRLSIRPSMPFTSSAPGLNESCDELMEMLREVDLGSAVILHVAYPVGDTDFNLQPAGDSMSTTRDLFVCGALARTDLPAAQIGLPDAPTKGVHAEVWVYPKDSSQYEKAYAVAKAQTRTEPGAPAWDEDNNPLNISPPSRPPGEARVLSVTLFHNEPVVVYGLP